MIVFDLSCGHQHRFEAWFGSSADYESQQARGLIRCPVCDDARIEKAVMAPAVSAKGNRDMRRTPDLKALRAEIEASCDDVGPRFAQEARKRAAAQEAGESPRGCIGQATVAEVLDLVSDDIPVAPLPFRPNSMADA